MSETPIEVVRVYTVEPHPQADRLEIVKVLNTQFISAKGEFKARDLCVYFPPDMMIPEDVAKELGVANYLKHSVYPGDLEKSKCRIGAIRLRGVASFGFGIPAGIVTADEGSDVTAIFGGKKYQPPETFNRGGGNSMRQPEAFHKYTDIQHYYRYAAALPVATPIRITEKIHGTNSRVGLIYDDGWEFMCGTHYRRVQEEDAKGRLSLYWAPLTDKMKEMLEYISCQHTTDGGFANVIVFGEIYGNKIQPMDYGTDRGKGYRVFDISVNGEYLNWSDVYLYCKKFGIETVTVLYQGCFSSDLVDKLISGPTTLADPDKIKHSFKGREGVVITPLRERYSDVLRGRLVLKAVSPDYYEAMK